MLLRNLQRRSRLCWTVLLAYTGIGLAVRQPCRGWRIWSRPGSSFGVNGTHVFKVGFRRWNNWARFNVDGWSLARKGSLRSGQARNFSPVGSLRRYPLPPGPHQSSPSEQSLQLLHMNKFLSRNSRASQVCSLNGGSVLVASHRICWALHTATSRK